MTGPLRRLAAVVLASAAWFAAGPSASQPLSAECGPAPAGAICADGPWFEFASMSVAVSQGPVRSRYDVTLGAGRDILVKIDEANPRYRGRAQAILIDGSVLGSRREGGLPATGIDLMNDPLLAAQEVASLLQIALPRGPSSVTKATAVRADGKRILAASTPAMSSYYGPPWTAEGRVTPAGPREFVFELTLRFRVATPDGKVTDREHVHRYSGRASYPARRPRIPDAMSLAGWTIESPAGGTLAFATLGEARRKLGVAPAR